MNNISKILNKRKALEKYKSAIISALKETLHSFDIQKEFVSALSESEEKPKLTLEQIETSINKYQSLQKKIEEDKELLEAEYKMLAICLVDNANKMANTGLKLCEAAKQLNNLSKVFISGVLKDNIVEFPQQRDSE